MTPLEFATMFHEAYERLAPEFGYVTRVETRAFDPTSPNGRLMVAVCTEISRQLGWDESGIVGDRRDAQPREILVKNVHNCVVTMTHFDRPDCTRQSLAALARCEGIGHCFLVLHAEPDNPAVLAQLRAVDFCKHDLTVNAARLGVDPNTVRTLDHGFTLSDYVVHVEDDILLAPDALLYFWWARARYARNPRILAVSGFNRDDVHHPAGFHRVARRAWFHPWGIGMWRDRWVRHRGHVLEETGTDPATLTRDRHAGPRKTWDSALGVVQQRDGLLEVHPMLSRVQNIGATSSIHSPAWFTPEWHRVNQHVEHWAGDGRCMEGGEFRELDPEP